jgi:nucleoside-diphosphate-sugar epimerase
VLITGAAGFIGCRTAELLRLADGWDVCALVHNPGSASRLARLPVEMVQGTLCSRDDVERAVEGCEAVVHCAYGKSWGCRREIFAVTVEGTRLLAEAARKAGVRRFVHLSTIAVHGTRQRGALEETSPVQPDRDDYAEGKAKAEKVVARAVQQGLPAVVLRLANVYGPFSQPFTVRPVRHLAEGLPVLVGRGDTPSNTVYVDNVVAAIRGGLEVDDERVVGQVFMITDGDDVSWADFHGYYARALEVEMRSVSLEEIERLRAAQAGAAMPLWSPRAWFRACKDLFTSTELMALGKKLLQTDPLGRLPRRVLQACPRLKEGLRHLLELDRPSVHQQPGLPSPAMPPLELFELYAHPAPVRVEKARRILGYSAVVPRDRAMELTLAWLRSARLI